MKVDGLKASKTQAIQCAGAIVAFLIGSGFASGQEVMQFFSAYGPVYGGLGSLITLFLLSWSTAQVLRDARILQLADANGIFRYYCGNYLGAVFEWLSPLFLFGVYVIMLSGAGSLLNEYYGLPEAAGRVLMLMLSLATVLLGLKRLTRILGFIGPMIILCTVIIGMGCILKNPAGIVSSVLELEVYPMTRAAKFWWLSGIIYATFCGFTLMPYLAGIGKSLAYGRESRMAGIMGAGSFSVTVMILCYGILANLEQVYDKAVPTVYMADCLFAGAGTFFSLVMLAGIYTTAVPMLWSSCNKLVQDDGSNRFRAVAVILGMIAFVGGRLPFGTLVNIIYPYMGYFGIIVFLGILYRRLKNNKPEEGENRKQSANGKERTNMGFVTGKKIGFVGGGRMGEAIFGGILRAGLIPPQDMYVSDISEPRLAELKEIHGVNTINSSTEEGIKELVTAVDIVFIATLPQIASQILPVVNSCLEPKSQVVFSIMGGVRLEYIENYITETPLIRVMPNTPMSVNEGCAGICSGKNAARDHIDLALEIFNSIGLGLYMPESMIDPLTGISGCGPAFCGQFIGALADGGVELGLTREMAIQIAAQTLVGTGKMVLESGLHPEVLKDQVCSPAGGTIAGTVALDKLGFRGAVITAVEESVSRMREVAKNS